MASVLTTPYIEVRVYKYMTGDPLRGWGNTYEIWMGETGSLIDPDNCQALAGAIAAAEKELHLDWVQYDRAVVASWQEDSHPYDPTSFVTVDLSAYTGGRSTIGQKDLGMDTALKCRRQAALGRPGKLEFRQSIGTNDLDAGGSGKQVLNNTSRTALSEDLTALYDVIQAFVQDTDPTATLAMLSPYDGPPTVRTVLGLAVLNPGPSKFNHKWFNRTTTP